MRIERITPTDPDVLRLLRQSDEYMNALYPPESIHAESVDGLRRESIALFGCYVAGALAGCGAAKIVEDAERYGEIKRLFVSPSHRGRGLSVAIMAVLERHLADAGVDLVRIEVGTRQPEALGLYARLGYRTRPPFGGYVSDPLSVFMEKALAAAGQS